MKVTSIVHWRGGLDILACAVHTFKLAQVSEYLGFPLSVTPWESSRECENCANERVILAGSGHAVSFARFVVLLEIERLSHESDDTDPATTCRTASS
jgi:hypothetical protein